MHLFFAPLQGYTDYLYRNAHRLLVGGVDAYFSPFVRWDGSLRNKDVRDVSASNNEGTPARLGGTAGLSAGRLQYGLPVPATDGAGPRVGAAGASG